MSKASAKVRSIQAENSKLHIHLCDEIREIESVSNNTREYTWVSKQVPRSGLYRLKTLFYIFICDPIKQTESEVGVIWIDFIKRIGSKLSCWCPQVDLVTSSVLNLKLTTEIDHIAYYTTLDCFELIECSNWYIREDFLCRYENLNWFLQIYSRENLCENLWAMVHSHSCNSDTHTFTSICLVSQ